jgi:collagenase-like PrtC family protease
MILNGEPQDLGDIKYLLSPQDLMAVELVPDLIAAGVTCFKIEGRLKGPEYVALTTQVASPSHTSSSRPHTLAAQGLTH